MNRQPIQDGQWFDIDKATRFEEATHWDGRNHISDATSSQWDHQWLYRTASGRWVLHHWSQYQGKGESYEEISDDAAARWLVTNNREHPDAAEAIAALEI